MNADILSLSHYERPAATAQVTLEITRGKARQRLRPVSGRVFLIGTASDCDLVLGDLSFPEVYAYLFVNGSKVSIRWLGAGPELLVGGERTDRSELWQGDEVRFGSFELRILIGHRPPDRDRQLPLVEFAETDVSDMLTEPAVVPFSSWEHCPG
jgi:hypothetical protein